MILLEKYEPKCIGDILGHSDAITKIINHFKRDRFSTILIFGPTGSGKTTIIKTILKELNFNVKFYNSVLQNDNLISEMVNLNNNNIKNSLQTNFTFLPTALVIDNLDHITLSNEKTLVDKVITFNLQKKRFPLILINSYYSFKDHPNLENVTKFELPFLSQEVLKSFARDILHREGLMVDNDILAVLVGLSQRDIRRLLNLIQDILMTFTKDEPLEKIKSYLIHCDKKDINLSLFESTKEILCSHKNISKIVSLYNNDKVLLPLTIQENFAKFVFDKGFPQKERCTALTQISTSISNADIIETDIYTDQNWDLQRTHCFFGLYKPVRILNRYKEFATPQDIKYPINFSSELNKTSLKNINRKNIFSVSAIFGNSLSEILHQSLILNTLLRREEFDKIKDLLSDYRIEDLPKSIETIIKIDKCNDNIFQFNTRTKKNF